MTKITSVAKRVVGSSRSEWRLQAVIAAVIVAYGVSTLVVHRPPSGYNTFWDGWVQNIASVLPAIPLLLRARRSPRLRSAWLAMAAGVVLYTLADLVYIYHDQNLHPIPSPAPSDAFFLSCNVAFIIGFAILTQSSFGRVHASVRLDGAIAGLAIGAVAAIAWFEPVLHVSGRPFQAAVDLAYPVCALVLLVLLVAGLAPHRFRPDLTTILLMTGVAFSVAGSVIFLNRSAAGTYVAGTLLGETWLLSFFFIGLAASVRDRRRTGGTRVSVSSPTGIAVVPVVFGVVSLGRAGHRHLPPRLCGRGDPGHRRPRPGDLSHGGHAARGAPLDGPTTRTRAPTTSRGSRTDGPSSKVWSRGCPPSRRPLATPECCWSTSTVSRR
jgi:hypothetical protein